MRRTFSALIIAVTGAGGAAAAPAFDTHLPAEPKRPSWSLQIIEDPVVDRKPVHNSGMLVSTPVMPNGTIGLGIIKASPNRLAPGEWRLDNNAPRSRKAAVTFRMQF